jgi:hypothetical protein
MFAGHLQRQPNTFAEPLQARHSTHHTLATPLPPTWPPPEVGRASSAVAGSPGGLGTNTIAEAKARGFASAPHEGLRHAGSVVVDAGRARNRGRSSSQRSGRRTLPLVVRDRPAPRGAIQPGGVKGPTSGRRNGREKLRGSLIPEVRWRAGAAPDDRATVRRQRAGCGSKAERCRRRTSVRSPDTGQQPRNWRLWAVGMLDPGCCSGSSRPTVVCSGGRGRAPCCGSARRCPRGTAGRRPCRLVDSERGKRPGGARRTRRLGSGAGAPSAVAAGAWRRTRSSRGSHAPPWRAGKPSTGRRGPVSTQHDWMGGGRR